MSCPETEVLSSNHEDVDGQHESDGTYEVLSLPVTQVGNITNTSASQISACYRASKNFNKCGEISNNKIL